MQRQNVDRRSRRQAGVSLVEVFVALLVLSVGLIALAKLQVDLVRGGGDSRARAAALAIAEGKLEDLRTFSKKEADPGVTWPVPDGQPLAWSMIADNAGGRIAPGLIDQAGVQYNLFWNASPPQATEGPTGSGNNSFYRVATVTVEWAGGGDEQSQQVTLSASIPDTPPALTALASSPITGGEGPAFTHVRGEAPEVIAIDVGPGLKRETSKPLPTVKKTADSTMVTFDVVTYHTNNNAVARREEFVTISCKCTFDGTGPARTPAKATRVGATLLRDQPGKIVTKTVGIPADTQQPPLCNICCRDHHDYTDGTDNYRYNPEDTSNSNHAHYLKDNLNSEVSPTSSDPYDEACRLKRVNGIFQVFEDWNLRTLTVLPKTDLELGATKSDEYVQAVQEYVIDFANAKANNSTPPSALNFTPSVVSVGNGTSQLLSRAIYIDNMPANLLEKVKGMLDVDPNDPAVLSFIPFYEVHLTKLADWSVYPDLTKVTVTSDPIQTDALGLVNNLYSRGFVQPQANATAGTATIIASAKSYNSGVTGTDPINTTENVIHPRTASTVGNGNNAVTYYYSGTRPGDEVTPQHKDGSMDVTVVASAGNIIVSGGMRQAKGSNTIDVTKINAPSVSGVNCSTTNASGQIKETFTCTVTPGPTGEWSGTIHFSSSANYVFCLEDNGQDAKTTGNNQVPAIQCTALNNGDWTPSEPLTAAYQLNIWVSTPVP